MRRRSARTLAIVVGTALLLRAFPALGGSPLSNDPSPLAVCQDTVRTAAIRLAVDAHRAVSACLTRGVECLVNDPTTQASCCDRASARCRDDLQKLDKARAGFVRYIGNRRCSVVPFADVLSAEGLGYESIRASCASLAPAVTIDTLDDLAACLARLEVAATACAAGTRDLPRGAEALACTGLEAAFRAATDADLATCASAPAATASVAAATPTPAVQPTATPKTSATPTAARTATALPTASATFAPTSTAIATPQKTATAVAVTSTPAPTATPTPVVTATTTAVPTGTPSAAVTSAPTASATVAATVVATTTPTRTATPTSTRTATPTRTPTPVPTPVCGNGVKETGEDCDDGNTLNCDACPANCKNVTAPVQCSSTTVRHAQKIHLALAGDAPPGTLLSAGLFCIEYPSGVVALPGTGNVTGRVSGVNAITSLNDFNNAVQLGLVATPGFTSADPVISFDLCSGATAPPPGNFTCVVKSASNQGDSIDPLSLVECTPQ